VATLGFPPPDLRGFPRQTLHANVALFRIHRDRRGPWWFSSNGSGRFDLDPPGGTCYLSLSALGAFVEVFRTAVFVDAIDTSDRRLSTVYPPRDLLLADCTSSRARMFGVNAAVHSTPDYSVTRAWAAAFHDQGFDGVRYYCSHDPSQREVGIALFGDDGEAGWPFENTSSLGADVLEEVKRRFGINVVLMP
jgi:hypothetical protein